jgi:PAS domain S-box-containing protein
MNDEDKTKEQLIDEIKSLRQRVAESETNEAERKIAQEALRKSEDTFRAIFHSLSDGLLLADRETKKFLMGNPAICNMLGYTLEELNRLGLRDIHPEDHLPSVLNRFEEITGRRNKVAKDIPVRRKDGSVFYADITGSLPILFNGRESLMGVFRDITEHKQAENALKESEQKYRELVDFLPISVFELDKRGIVTGTNRAANEAFGYSDEDVRNGISAFDTVIPEDRHRARENLQRLFNGEATRGIEYTSMRKDGSTFPAIMFSNPIIRDGKVVGVRGAVIDISDRKGAEEALEESKRRLSEIIDFAPDATFAVDKDGKVIAWNRAIEEMTGVKASDMLGKGNYEYSLPFYGVRRPQLIDLVFISDEEIENKYHFVRKDGEIILAEADVPVRGTIRALWGKACPLYDNKGNVVGAIESIRDITERKQMESSLASEQERLISILDGIPIPTFIIDDSGQVVLWNRYNEAYTGIPKSSILGRPLDLSFLFRGKASPSLAELMLQMGDDDLMAKFEHSGLKKSKVIPNAFESVGRIWIKGEERILTIQAARVHDSKGEVVGAVQTAQDITEREQVEEERLQLEQRLHQAQKAESLGRMAGAIAHHFNSLLGAVMGRLELALDDLHQAPRPRKHLTEAMKASQQAAGISRLMLTYLGHTVQRKEPCNVVEAVREALLLLGPSLPQRVHVNAKLPPEAIIIQGDKAHIEQALTNLILNAGEAVGDGDGEITVTVHVMTAEKLREFRLFPSGWEPTENSYVSISISDTGSGFDPATMERIFDPFFTTKFTGRGLGLAVVLGIVRAHEGALAVESQSGLGSIFRAFFPLPAQQTLHPGQKPTVDFEPFKEGGLVLVVEDEPVVRDMAEAMLKEFGYEVIVAGDGLEALEKFREHQDEVRLVLLDQSMPGMNGWETLAALRALRSDLPAILASGYDEAQAMQGDHREQPQVFLQKPYRMKDLEAALGTALKTSPPTNKGALSAVQSLPIKLKPCRG